MSKREIIIDIINSKLDADSLEYFCGETNEYIAYRIKNPYHNPHHSIKTSREINDIVIGIDRMFPVILISFNYPGESIMKIMTKI